jgi:hypothetical protein
MRGDPRKRSFRTITGSDLLRLAALARLDRQSFFARYPDWGRHYAGRFLGSALCQGAALHYVGGEVGINDFDVYSFFAVHPNRAWYAKRIKSVDFGIPKFGRSEVSPSSFVGRRVDLMARALDVVPNTDVATSVMSYLEVSRTRTAAELASKAVVLLEPTDLVGTVIWPIQGVYTGKHAD